MKNAQSAAEFTLLFAALLFIFIPAFYLLTRQALDTQTEAVEQQIQSMARSLVDESREIYYAGRYSRQVVTLNLPPGIVSMNTTIIKDSSNYEYYLLVSYMKKHERVFTALRSDVALVYGTACILEPCLGTLECYRCPFEAEAVRNGVKSFELESTSRDIWGSSADVVEIERVEW